MMKNLLIWMVLIATATVGVSAAQPGTDAADVRTVPKVYQIRAV